MRIDHATPDDIYETALLMRQSDFDEFSALSWHATREALARDLSERYGHGKCISARDDEGEIIAIGDVVEIRPNVGSLMFFATERFQEVAVPLTRFIVQRLFPAMVKAGLHRIEAISVEGHKQAHRWIEALGLTQEASFPSYGKGGETFIQFAWVKRDV